MHAQRARRRAQEQGALAARCREKESVQIRRHGRVSQDRSRRAATRWCHARPPRALAASEPPVEAIGIEQTSKPGKVRCRAARQVRQRKASPPRSPPRPTAGRATASSGQTRYSQRERQGQAPVGLSSRAAHHATWAAPPETGEPRQPAAAAEGWPQRLALALAGKSGAKPHAICNDRLAVRPSTGPSRARPAQYFEPCKAWRTGLGAVFQRRSAKRHGLNRKAGASTVRRAGLRLRNAPAAHRPGALSLHTQAFCLERNRQNKTVWAGAGRHRAPRTRPIGQQDVARPNGKLAGSAACRSRTACWNLRPPRVGRCRKRHDAKGRINGVWGAVRAGIPTSRHTPWVLAARGFRPRRGNRCPHGTPAKCSFPRNPSRRNRCGPTHQHDTPAQPRGWQQPACWIAGRLS